MGLGIWRKGGGWADRVRAAERRHRPPPPFQYSQPHPSEAAAFDGAPSLASTSSPNTLSALWEARSSGVMLLGSCQTRHCAKPGLLHTTDTYAELPAAGEAG